MILSDERNHASMIDGIRASRAERAIFRHNDLEHLRELLEALPPEQPRIVAFESIYSMDGDIAPLREICALAAEHGALTYLDETHAAGAYGREGAGVAQALGAAARRHDRAGQPRQGLRDARRLHRRAGQRDRQRAQPRERLHLHDLAAARRSPRPRSRACATCARRAPSAPRSRAASQPCARPSPAPASRPMPSESHIVPVLVPGAERCREVAQRLLDEHSIYVQPINYPSVPRGAERLRIAPTPAHAPGARRGARPRARRACCRTTPHASQPQPRRALGDATSSARRASTSSSSAASSCRCPTSDSRPCG